MPREYNKALRHQDFGFNWDDVQPIAQLRNESDRPMTFAKAEIIQGGTDGAAVAGKVLLALPTTQYTMTTPAAFPARAVCAQNALFVEHVLPGEFITATVTQASQGAKEATLRLHYWQE